MTATPLMTRKSLYEFIVVPCSTLLMVSRGRLLQNKLHDLPGPCVNIHTPSPSFILALFFLGSMKLLGLRVTLTPIRVLPYPRGTPKPLESDGRHDGFASIGALW